MEGSHQEVCFFLEPLLPPAPRPALGGKYFTPSTAQPELEGVAVLGVWGTGDTDLASETWGSLAVENSAWIPSLLSLLDSVSASILYRPPILTKTLLIPSPPAQKRKTLPPLSPFLPDGRCVLG